MNRADLVVSLTALGTAVGIASTGCADAFNRYDTQLILANLQAGAMVSMGVVNVPRAAEFDLPVSFIKGPAKVSGVQFDLMLPSGFTFVSASAGPVASAAGKSVQANPVSGGVRILIFGLNQTELGNGLLANIKLATDASTPLRGHSLGLSQITGSDPQGNTIVLSGLSGTVVLK